MLYEDLGGGGCTCLQWDRLYPRSIYSMKTSQHSYLVHICVHVHAVMGIFVYLL